LARSLKRVLHQHRDGHCSDPAGHWRDDGAAWRDLVVIDIAGEAGAGFL